MLTCFLITSFCATPGWGSCVCGCLPCWKWSLLSFCATPGWGSCVCGCLPCWKWSLLCCTVAGHRQPRRRTVHHQSVTSFRCRCRQYIITLKWF